MTSQTQGFDPAKDARAFRTALGAYGTGVTVITCLSDLGPLGITANSFASLSLDPPLVLWSPARSSRRHDAFVAAERFAIHILSEEQRHVCGGFAGNGTAFDGFDWAPCPEGVPLIDNCLARFECTRHAVHEGGDHSIIVGQVQRAETRPGRPLLFFGGRYGRLAEDV